MKVVFHRFFQRDINSAMGYYDEEGGEELGDRFFEEVERAVERIRENPKGTHFVKGRNDLRRTPLKVFPYHIIYEESDLRLRFLVLRHDRRHPSYGLSRKNN